MKDLRSIKGEALRKSLEGNCEQHCNRASLARSFKVILIRMVVSSM